MLWQSNMPCERSKSPGGCFMKTWWGFMRFWHPMGDRCPGTQHSWALCTSSRSAWRRIWLDCWNKAHCTQVWEAKGKILKILKHLSLISRHSMVAVYWLVFCCCAAGFVYTVIYWIKQQSLTETVQNPQFTHIKSYCIHSSFCFFVSSLSIEVRRTISLMYKNDVKIFFCHICAAVTQQKIKIWPKFIHWIFTSFIHVCFRVFNCYFCSNVERVTFVYFLYSI